MEKWNLFVVEGGEAVKETLTRAKTFAEAEEIAKKLFAEYDDGNYCDLCVFCTPHNPYNNKYMDFHPEDDFPVYARVSGEMQWNRMHVGEFCQIGMLYDKDFIDEIREDDEKDKPRHISDLSRDELERLYGQIRWGSIYLSDYRNDLNVDEEEVYDKAEDYTDMLYYEFGEEYEKQMSAEDFADYCTA